MIAADRVAEIFADARAVHDSALRMLEEGDIRDAAEKAWGATKRATDALILARTGEEPRTTARTSNELDDLARRDNRVNMLVGRYYSRISQLHGSCFYDGICNDQTERRIRETSDYIRDAENLTYGEIAGMIDADRVAEIFADARAVHDSALRVLEEGDIRDAAEKAWGATKRATDALILARTGEEPEKTPQTSIELGRLVAQDNAVRPLVGRYFSRQSQLHGDCFYLGLCEPISETERRIRETAAYISDAEDLAYRDL